MRRIIGSALAVGLVAAACGGGITPVQADLAQVEGHWMCDVQRYTFDDLSALQSELEGRVDGAGYTVADYKAFKTALAENRELRNLVRDVYEEYCT